MKSLQYLLFQYRELLGSDLDVTGMDVELN